VTNDISINFVPVKSRPLKHWNSFCR